MINRLSPKPETSEKLKAKQYGVATLIFLLIIIIMTVINIIWGTVMLGSGEDTLSLGFVISSVRNIILLFGAIDLFSAVYHFVLWNRNGRPHMDDDNNSVFSDWKSGERSPVKVSLVFSVGIIVLALVMLIQGFGK